ncbi:MAG: peptide ABC transporter substrate-binding protein [Anaerolineae bacterium]|nr:peptide ABC transporter substrate-binding protein [Anaerolineae bacterium]
MQRKHILFTLLIIATFVFSACTTAPTATTVVTEAPPVVQPTEAPPVAQPTEAPPVVEPTTAPAEKKVLTFIWGQEFDNLNPIYTNMWFVSVIYPAYMCTPWLFDDEAKAFPYLLKEMPTLENGGITNDGKTFTFKLRDDIKWSDGEPITSADFKFTYDMIMADSNAVSTRSPYNLITSVETPDDQTVVFNFPEPFASWQATLFSGSTSSTPIIPKHILQPVFDAEGTLDTAEWNRAPTVGSGPFVFEEWQSGSFARFVRNDNYWLEPAKVDELFFKFVPDDASNIAALVSGDGDVGTFFGYPDVPQLQAANITILNSFSGYNEGIYINLHPEKGNPALKDVKVRQAIAYAFNRQKLVDDLLLGLTGVAATDWDKSPWVDPTITPYPYDPDKAKTLLAEAGWTDTNGDGTVDKDGVELVLKWGTTNRQVRQDTQAVGQQDLAAVGIGTELLSYDSDTFFNGYQDDGPSANFSLDLIEYSDSPYWPDPNTTVWLCSNIPSDANPAGSSPTGLCDETLDGLFLKQLTQFDFAERQQTFYEITKLIYDNVYWLGIWQDPDLFSFSDRMTGYKMSGATPFFNIAEWDIK